MSTRAIVGVELPNGNIVGGWQWSDGFPNSLGYILRKYFVSEKDVKELFEYGEWSVLRTKRQQKEYEKWCVENAIYPDTQYSQLSNGIFVATASHHKKGIQRWKDRKDALGQDLNYVYLFKDGKWETLSYRDFKKY